MGLYEGRGQLSKAMKDLLDRWQSTKLDWRDAQAEQLEREVLDLLARDVQAAGSAMDQIGTVVKQAQRDCA